MKWDGRKFDHRTLEALRLMAVVRVRDGGKPSSVLACYGLCRTTIYKWLAIASKPGVGPKALQSRPTPGRPRRLTSRQERQVFRRVNGPGIGMGIHANMAWTSARGPGRSWPT
jgi:transposase